MPGSARMTRTRVAAADAAVAAVAAARAAGVDMIALTDAAGLALEAIDTVAAAAEARGLDQGAMEAAGEVHAMMSDCGAGMLPPPLEDTLDRAGRMSAVVTGGLRAQDHAQQPAAAAVEPAAGTKRVRDDGGAASEAEVMAAGGGAAAAVPPAKRSKDAEAEVAPSLRDVMHRFFDGSAQAAACAACAPTALARVLDSVRLVDDEEDGRAYAAWEATALMVPGTSVFCTDADLLVTAFDGEDEAGGIVDVGVDSASAAIRALGAFDATETFARCAGIGSDAEPNAIPQALNAALAAIRVLCDAVSGSKSMVSMGFRVFNQIALGAVIRTMRAMQKRIAALDPLDVHTRTNQAVATALAIDYQVHNDTYIDAFGTGASDAIRAGIFFDQNTRLAAAFNEATIPGPAHGREVLLYTQSALDTLRDVGTSLMFGRLAASGISSAFVHMHSVGVFRNGLAPTCRIATHSAHDSAGCNDLRYYVRASQPGETEARAYMRMHSIMTQVFIALEAANEHVDIFAPSLTPEYTDRGGDHVHVDAAHILSNVCVHTTDQDIMVFRRPGDKGLCVFSSGGVRVTIGAYNLPRRTISVAQKSPTPLAAPPTYGRDLFNAFLELVRPAHGFKGGDRTTTELEAMQRIMDDNPARAAACSIADLFLPDTLGANAPFALACIDKHEYAEREMRVDGDALLPLF